MRGVRILCSIVLVLFIILFGSVLIIGGSAWRFLYPSVYHQTFEQTGVYHALDTLNANKSILGTAMFIKGNLQEIADTALLEVLAYIRGARAEPMINVEIDT